MTERKIIAVVGATGAQGGGLARAILRDESGGFALRALTRNPESETAQALAARGGEVMEADLDDADSVRRAFAGAHGAYCMTNFWEHFSPEREMAQARTMAEAARETGIRHAIWSTFEDVRDFVSLDDDRMPTLQGSYKVPHFDGKAEANRFFEEAGVPTTFLLTSAYSENLIHFGWGPQRTPEGGLAVVFPMGDAKLPIIAAEDIGKCAYGIFKRGREYVDRTVGVAGEHLMCAELAAQLSEALDMPITYTDVPPDVYRGFGFPGAEDLGNMFQFKRDFEDIFTKHRSLEESRRLNPELQTFRDWLAENAQRIPIPEAED